MKQAIGGQVRPNRLREQVANSSGETMPTAHAVGSAIGEHDFQISAIIIEQTSPAVNSTWRDLRDMRRMRDLIAFVANGTFGMIGKVK